MDPRGELRIDAPELVDSLIKKFSGPGVSNLKVVLLVDELEDHHIRVLSSTLRKQLKLEVIEEIGSSKNAK